MRGDNNVPQKKQWLNMWSWSDHMSSTAWWSLLHAVTWELWGALSLYDTTSQALASLAEEEGWNVAWGPRSSTPHFHSHPTGQHSHQSSNQPTTKARRIGEHVNYLLNTKHLWEKYHVNVQSIPESLYCLILSLKQLCNVKIHHSLLEKQVQKS